MPNTRAETDSLGADEVPADVAILGYIWRVA